MCGRLSPIILLCLQMSKSHRVGLTLGGSKHSLGFFELEMLLPYKADEVVEAQPTNWRDSCS